MFESLENRLLCASTSYNLLTLLGYNTPGSAYRYATTATVGKNDLIDASTATTTSKIVTRKGVNGSDPLYVAKTTTTDNEGNQSIALTQTSAGIQLTSDAVTAKGVNIVFNFSNVQLAPTSLATGRTVTDTGTVKGSIHLDTSDTGQLDGSFSGSANTSVTIYGTKSVTVRGHTYANAVEGAFSINVDGTLKVSKYGISQSGPVTLTQQETFYAVPGVGIVTDRRQVVVSGSISQSGTYKVPLSARDDLINYVLGSNA